MQTRTKKLTTLSMLGAIAYLTMVFMRIPVLPAAAFLKYEPKDAIIVIGGFLYGPLAAFMVSFAVSVIEMLTVSTTGIIGLLMNIISSSAFACTAAAIYKRNRTMRGAVCGLVSGACAMCAAMLIWNYIVTPIYMGVPRSVVAGMMLTVFLPFNLLKSSLNAAIAVIIYKPIRNALAKAGFAGASEHENGTPASKTNIGAFIAALFIIISCALFIFAVQGKMN